MAESFFEKPILNSPYEYPRQHWELDSSGQPTNQILTTRRRAEFITPIPKPRKRQTPAQGEIVFNEAREISTEEQQYEKTAAVINQVRQEVDRWRAISNPEQWKVSPITRRLLQHWRGHRFEHIRPFFCQVEAVETAIWLTEVAPLMGNAGRSVLGHLEDANKASNPGLSRLALKLATGAGKTTVMAMLIAWQAINAARSPGSRRFTRSFLIVAPGLTIRDRLRVLQPNDPDTYYKNFELVPGDMLGDIQRANVVITNYHAFKLRETL
jgi:type III restriction enzyme